MGLDQSIVRITGDLREEVACFRKANFLHGWVERELNGGRETNVEHIAMPLEALGRLELACAQVLRDRDPFALQPTPGFFFGSYAADEWYFDQVRELRSVVSDLIDQGADNVFYWSWW